MTDLEEARKRWLREQPLYQNFGKLISDRVTTIVRGAGIYADCSWRTKETDSLIKKLIRKPTHTYESLGDKVGVRVIVRYLHEVSEVVNLLSHSLACKAIEKKEDLLQAHEVGYRSTHLDISLTEMDPEATAFSPMSFHAELQVRTLAQHLWSEMAHDTIYKSVTLVDESARRRILLLSGLIEVADNEFTRLEREVFSSSIKRESAILSALERQYYKLTTRRGDNELSIEAIRLLAPLYDQQPIETISNYFEAFFQRNERMLRRVFEKALELPSERSAFLFQPEVFMIVDQLENDEYRLRQIWSQSFPEKELERLAVKFGYSFV